MKNLLLILALNTGVLTTINAQQWDGSSSTGAAIHRIGRVGINTTTPEGYLHIRAANATNEYNTIFDGNSLSFKTDKNVTSYINKRDNGRLIFRYGSDYKQAMTLVNGNLGVGTTSPLKKLEVKGDDGVGIRISNQQANTWDIINSKYGKLDFVRGSTNTMMRIDQFGKVGIGTESPLGKLHVQYTGEGAIISKATANATHGAANVIVDAATNYPGRFLFRENGSNKGWLDYDKGKFNIKNHSYTALFTVLANNGNVGIGSSNPDKKLTVNGTVHCKEVKVDLDIPADYVFEKYYLGKSKLKADYTMPTLEEVEAYTKANHHLPEMPSAKTIQEEGLQLKEMSNLLLQKVEELTLYTIEQEKRIKSLEAALLEAKK